VALGLEVQPGAPVLRACGAVDVRAGHMKLLTSARGGQRGCDRVQFIIIIIILNIPKLCVRTLSPYYLAISEVRRGK